MYTQQVARAPILCAGINCHGHGSRHAVLFMCHPPDVHWLLQLLSYVVPLLTVKSRDERHLLPSTLPRALHRLLCFAAFCCLETCCSIICLHVMPDILCRALCHLDLSAQCTTRYSTARIYETNMPAVSIRHQSLHPMAGCQR